MNKELELISLYKNKGYIIDNKEIIVFNEFCHEFIKSCQNLEIKILGIDGYFLKNNTVGVNLAEISDFSKTQQNQLNCYELASTFINDMLKNGKSDGYLFTLSESTT